MLARATTWKFIYVSASIDVDRLLSVDSVRQIYVVIYCNINKRLSTLIIWKTKAVIREDHDSEQKEKKSVGIILSNRSIQMLKHLKRQFSWRLQTEGWIEIVPHFIKMAINTELLDTYQTKKVKIMWFKAGILVFNVFFHRRGHLSPFKRVKIWFLLQSNFSMGIWERGNSVPSVYR